MGSTRNREPGEAKEREGEVTRPCPGGEYSKEFGVWRRASETGGQETVIKTAGGL